MNGQENPMRGAVLITGASSGIGAACAVRLASNGYQVYAGVRKVTDGAALQEQSGGRITPIALDVTDAQSIAAARLTIESHSNRLVALVNNAGIGLTGPLEALPLTDLRRQLEVNIIGQVAVTQAFLPLIRQSTGRIIMMGSVAGRLSLPFSGPYSASKFGLEAITIALRMELRTWNIPVVLIEPGSIATHIWAKVEASEASLMERLPEEIRLLYSEAIGIKRAYSMRVAQRGIPADAVARVVMKALVARRPRTRYLVGRDASTTAIVRLIPDLLRERLLRRYIGLA